MSAIRYSPKLEGSLDQWPQAQSFTGSGFSAHHSVRSPEAKRRMSFAYLLLFACLPLSARTVMAEFEPQLAFHISDIDHDSNALGSSKLAWDLSLSDEWDVLGPFPIHAREQHFLSPSFPINLSEEIDFLATYPSSYVHGGTVGWRKTTSADGSLTVSFPNVRWESLRATEGWAVLQHHSLLRTSITVIPAMPESRVAEPKPRLLVSITQGSFFTVVPSTVDGTFIAKWYSGNIYAMGASMPQVVELPVSPSPSEPTTYNLFISGDYEIRLFGDPQTRDSGVPQLQIGYSSYLQIPHESLLLQPSHHVLPDYIDGWAFGEVIGIGLRSVDGWWTVTEAMLFSDSDAAEIDDPAPYHIAPSQTRVLPLRLIQRRPVYSSNQKFKLFATSSSGRSTTINIDIPIKHSGPWNALQSTPIKATYLSARSNPTGFLVKPPIAENVGEPHPPILALHGAGVDIFADNFWPEALPRQEHSWIIMPTGRTSWGLDWHGPSAEDAWSAVDALHRVLHRKSHWHPWQIAKDTRVVVLGHSNGGQGTWHIAARYPDRVIAAVPAAAYIKSQAYIPLTLSRSAHYVDPALRSILESSLTPDDNDLFLSNLVHTPILAIHGGNDENVPVWHTREIVSVLKTWNPEAPVTYKEDPGAGHWYPTVFNNDVVRQFIQGSIERVSSEPYFIPPTPFTLTVSVPRESSSLHGFRIIQLSIPGRLGRISVAKKGQVLNIRTQNVASFSLDSARSLSPLKVLVDSSRFNLDAKEAKGQYLFILQSTGWKTNSGWHDAEHTHPVHPSGRMLNILTSSGPLTIVVPEKSSFYLSAALRLAHDLDTYHKLDTEIVKAESAIEQTVNGSLQSGNIIVMGGTTNAFTCHLLAAKRTAFQLQDGQLSLKGGVIHTGLAVLLLHPHPINATGLALIIFAEEQGALERALRLFPMRTGISLPDWIVVNDKADVIGSAGVEAAGVWGNGWTWNEPMSF